MTTFSKAEYELVLKPIDYDIDFSVFSEGITKSISKRIDEAILAELGRTTTNMLGSEPDPQPLSLGGGLSLWYDCDSLGVTDDWGVFQDCGRILLEEINREVVRTVNIHSVVRAINCLRPNSPHATWHSIVDNENQE